MSLINYNSGEGIFYIQHVCTIMETILLHFDLFVGSSAYSVCSFSVVEMMNKLSSRLSTLNRSIFISNFNLSKKKKKGRNATCMNHSITSASLHA